MSLLPEFYMKKPLFPALFVLLWIFFCVLPPSAQATKTTTDKEKSYSVKVPPNAPRMKLMGSEFILVQGAALPEHLQVMHSRWDKIVAQHDPGLFQSKKIPLKGQHKDQWAALVSLTKKSSDSLKTLRNVNGFFNRIMSRKDDDSYGIGEYWATPQEFLSNGSGDCEDYAITKYFALKYLGWDPQKLWVIFLREHIRNSGHAVLLAQDKRGLFVLDNLSKPGYLLVPAAQYAKQVTPFAMVNHKGLWLRVNGEENPKSTAKTQP